jgi:putative lipoic acid-binding regulatory protein
MNKAFDISTFKEKLDAETDFPSLYMFKFIVPSGKEEEIAALLPNNEMTLKTSSKGKYVSATIKAMMPSSEAIVEVYRKASHIEGVISL